MQNRDDDNTSAEPHGVSRRSFLAQSGAAAATAATATAWLPRLASGRPGSGSDPTLILVYLRGGADGLTWVAPVNDAHYTTNRKQGITRIEPPTVNEPRRWLVQSDGWALPPGAIDPSGAGVDIKLPFDAGDLTLAHGTGLAGNGRSHFEAQNFTEWGITPGGSPPSIPGWFARYLDKRSSTVSLRGIAHGPLLPISLSRAPATKAIEDISNVSFPGNTTTAPKRRDVVEMTYASSAVNELKEAAEDAFAALNLLENFPFPAQCPPGYPNSPFGKTMCNTAALLKQHPLEAVHVDIEGWDHHNSQRPLPPNPDPDTFFKMSQDLSTALGAFYQDMGGAAGTDSYVVVVMTEFGRRIMENLSAGTDHGTGGVTMILGDGVRTGSYANKVFYKDWEVTSGIAGVLDPTYPEDLEVTHDIRSVLGEIMLRRLGMSAVDVMEIFPGFSVDERGIVGA